MKSKSHDDLFPIIASNLESLANSLGKLEAQLKKSTDTSSKLESKLGNLIDAVSESNKSFDRVSVVVKNLYDKVTQLEVISKLLGGGLGPLFGQKK